MKEIQLEQHKKLLIDMLEYITNICKENHINYSLLGGSLIGAVRHKDIIPWDDDVDIVLMPKDYKKLIAILKNNNHGYYKLFDYERKDYHYPFPKLIDTRTIVTEKNAKQIDGYGVFLDIFKYHFLSNNSLIRHFEYRIQLITKKILGISACNPEKIKMQKNILKKMAYRIGSALPTRLLRDIYIKICNGKKTGKYMIINWPAYGYNKEIQLSKNMTKYKYVKFNRIQAQISENYDELLTTTFGDYMKLPPKEKRKTNHNMKAYWK